MGTLEQKHILMLIGLDPRQTRNQLQDILQTGGNPVSWKSKQQAVTAKSSAEAEYQAVAHGCCKLLLLKILLREMSFKQGGPRVGT